MNLTVDGVKLPGKAIPLIDEHREHSVEVRIPASPTDALNTQQAGFLNNDPVHGGDFVFGLLNHQRHRPRHADQPLNDTGGRTHGIKGAETAVARQCAECHRLRPVDKTAFG